jgi:hypothetical protein
MFNPTRKWINLTVNWMSGHFSDRMDYIEKEAALAIYRPPHEAKL